MPTLHWIGKEKVINHHQDVPYRVLEMQYTYKNGQETDVPSENKIIHGDNLEALKSLLPEYEGKVKCIYIDPPYNTGKEHWIYNDNVNDPKIRKWLGKVVGKESEDLSRHDKWLCMMYPRLKLLHKLLAADGVIYISIDDNEQANLKILCDEIFGVKNFLTSLVWENKEGGGSSDSKHFRVKHEYIISYSKDISVAEIHGVAITNRNRYNKTDQHESSRGPYYLQKLGMGSIQYSASLDYGIECEDGKLVYPKDNNSGKKACWRWSREKYNWGVINDFIVQQENKDGDWIIYTKQYLNCDNEGNLIDRTNRPMGVINNFSSTQASKRLEIILGERKFDYSKPVELIEHVLKIATTENSIVLDSFAGSGTTAHAVLNLNKEDGGNRKFILIEMEDYANTITAERAKRVIKGYGEGSKAVEGTGGDFSYYELGQTVFLEDEMLNEDIGVEKIEEYVWYTETKLPYYPQEEKYLLGTKDQIAYYFYYHVNAITTLDESFLRTLKTKANQYIIYADNCLLTKELMQKYHIVFKKIPRDITRF